MIKKICLILLAVFCFSSFTSSLDGRARVAQDGDFPEGLFAKTVGYLPGDTILVSNIVTDKAIDVLVVGSLDPSEGLAILLSKEAASALGIKNDSNVVVKITKRSGTLDEAVSGKAVLAKGDAELDSNIDEGPNESLPDETVSTEPLVTKKIAKVDVDENVLEKAEVPNEKVSNEIDEFEKPEVVETEKTHPEVVIEKLVEIEKPESEVKKDSEEPEVEIAKEEVQAEKTQPEVVIEKLVEIEKPENEVEKVSEEPVVAIAKEEVQAEPIVEKVDEGKTDALVLSDKVVVVELPAESNDAKVSEKVAVENEAITIEEPAIEIAKEEFVDEPIDEQVESEVVVEKKDEVPEDLGEVVVDEKLENETALDEVEELAFAEGVPEAKKEVVVSEKIEETAPLETEIAESQTTETEISEPYEAIVLDETKVTEAANKIAEAETVSNEVENAETKKLEVSTNELAKVETKRDEKKSLHEIVSEKANMQKGSYVQIAAYKEIQNARDALEKYKAQYPMVVLDETKGLKHVLVGPLALDECGVVLERFKAYGFGDAFIRKIK